MTLRVVELFAGIGAWGKALKNLNIDYEVSLAVECDKYPLTAFNAIHNTSFKIIDIAELDEKDVPDCDLICYSPPCQSFSVAGKQLGFDDKRGVLFFDALRIIEEKKPKYAIMENVKGLTQKRFKDEFKIMQEELKKIGYKNYWKVLNAKDYNIPQNRERVFLVSIREDIDLSFEFPEPLELTNKLLDYLEEDVVLPVLHNIYGGFKEKKARVFEEYSPTIRTSAGGGHIPSVVIKGSNVFTKHPKNYVTAIVDDTYKGREARVYLEYAPTIRAGRKGFKLVHKSMGEYSLIRDKKEIKDGEDYVFIREMSTLEAFRLMGFEDEDYYKARQAVNNAYYNGKDRSNTRMYRMAGNSIAVPVLEEIFKNLLLK